MADIDTQLAEAAMRCAAQGGQLTELRRQVLELVLRAEQPIQIGAQLYLKEFYESFGFRQHGEGYLEDGIPHIHMLRA